MVCVTKLCVKDCVCDKVVYERWCVMRVRWCVTKMCVKDEAVEAEADGTDSESKTRTPHKYVGENISCNMMKTA